MDALDRLSEEAPDALHANLLAGLALLRQRNRIGHDHVLERGISDPLDRLPAEHGMTRGCRHAGRTRVDDRVGGIRELRSWVLGWGSEVEVLALQQLRDEICEHARRMLLLYQ